MRRVLPPALAITAAAALLAGCGNTTPADEVQAVPMNTRISDLDPDTDLLPEVPQDALDEVDFGGTYVRQAAEGMERISFDPLAGTYRYVAPSGAESTGAFQRMADNRRIQIKDMDGESAYFGVAEGAVYRLADADTRADQISAAMQYRRDPTATGQAIILENGEEEPAQRDAPVSDAEQERVPAD